MTAPAQARLDSSLEKLEAAGEVARLQEIIEELRDLFGVDHMMYHWVSAAGDQYRCSTYAPAWVMRYVEKEYLRVDPVIQGCYQRYHPVDWKQLDWSGRASQAFLREAIEFGVGNQGYSVPIHGPNGQFALYTVSHSCGDDSWAGFTEKNRRYMILIAHAFNKKALDFEPDRHPGPAPALSPREVDAITLLAMGYSRAQVAQTLTISEHTLRTYVESARLKLGALNTVHAVARALSRGLIVLT